MAVTYKRIRIVKSCFKILFCVVVFRSYLHINDLRRNLTELEHQGDDSTIRDGGPLQLEKYEFHEEKFAIRHLMGVGHYAEDENCTRRGIESFLTFFTNEQRLNGAIIIHFLVAFYMCGMIGYNCDIYFVPALEVICEELNIQPDVAGATFMAAGSSAPEFFTAVIGTFISEDDTALSAIVGSAAFNVFVIISFCCFFGGKDVPLTWWPLFRDGVFYILSVLLLVVFIYDSEVQWWEGLIMTITYLLYILLMYFNPYLSEKAAKLSCHTRIETDTTSLIGQNNQEGGPSRSYGTSTGENQVESTFTKVTNENQSHLSLPTENKNGLVRSDKSDPMDSPISEYKQSQSQSQEIPNMFQPPESKPFRLLWIIGLPTIVLMFLTIPDCSKPKWRKWYIVTFIMSLVWLMGTSYVLYWMIVVMGYTFGFPDTVMGLTLLAGGTSVPDLLSSVIVTRHGFGDMALSNVIGSNIFDVLVCLGLLWFIKAATVQPVSIATDGLTFTSVTLMLTVAVVVIAIHMNGWKLSLKLGIFCFMIYLLFITVAIMRELGVFGGTNPPIYCPGPL